MLQVACMLALVAATVPGAAASGQDRAVGAAGSTFIKTPAGECLRGQQVTHVGSQTVCTHGPDDVSSSMVAAAQALDAPAAGYPKPPCAQDSDGSVSTGERMRIMYGYPADTTHDATDAARIVPWLRIADYNLSQRGGSQHYRFYCGVNSAGSAHVQIRVVKLLPIGADGEFTFEDMIASLYYQVRYGLGTKNYRHGLHDYVVFVDNIEGAYPHLGQGSIMADSRWDPSVNYNNSTSYYKAALIVLTTESADLPASLFMHETGHNLGAVQNDAPHASGAYHCYDENDIMCYSDGGPYFAQGGDLTYPTECALIEYFDCRGNDYYNAHPRSGTYIYRHWNLANSSWLTPPS